MHSGTYKHSQGGKSDQVSNFPKAIEVKRSQQETVLVMQHEVEIPGRLKSRRSSELSVSRSQPGGWGHVG